MEKITTYLLVKVEQLDLILRRKEQEQSVKLMVCHLLRKLKKYATSTSTAATKKTSTSPSAAAVPKRSKKTSTSNFTAGSCSGSSVTVNFKQSFNSSELSSKRQRKAKVPYDV